jgi:hypothetical protein
VAVQPASTKSSRSAAEYDPDVVDPGWAPPETQDETTAPKTPEPVRKTIPAVVVYGCILLVLVLLLVAIWGFGGFKKRSDLLQTMPPGTLFTTGPYEFRFTEATAQHKKKYDGTLYWEIVMIGEGRTTGNEPISPTALSDNGMFVSKDDASQQVKLPESVRMGRGDGYQQSRFTPGLPLTQYSVVFEYQDTYRPGPTIRFAVSDLVYKQPYLTSEEKGWRNGTYSHQFYLPVRVLTPLI